MSTRLLRLAVVTGSIREGRFGPTVAQWLVDEARAVGHFTIDVIDLAETQLPSVITQEFPPAVEALRPRVAEADAFVLVTPEYNRGYPASLKSMIDWYFQEWQAKPVAFVSYGGRAGGLRSVDHLGSVLSDLHAVPLRDVVSFHQARQEFDDNGRVHDPEGAGAAAKVMFDRLLWWGTALRDARAETPFNG